ncbi:MAG: hypothetical protein WC475_02700 [Candidatus Paceibacterota bacterium]
MRKGDGKIWLSHSGMDILYRCPRCFWLRYNRGIYQPEGIVSRLAGRFDIVLKNYFDIFRTTGELPPMVEGKLKGKLENPFQEVYFHPINEKYGFWGKLDECLITSENLHAPVDFKTASSDPRGKDIFPAYQNQLDEFSFLMESNGKKTAGVGYLIFFYPDHGEKLHDGFPMVIHLVTVKTDTGNVEPRIFQAIEVLEGKIPAPAANCPFCGWYDEMKKVLGESEK